MAAGAGASGKGRPAVPVAALSVAELVPCDAGVPDLAVFVACEPLGFGAGATLRPAP